MTDFRFPVLLWDTRNRAGRDHRKNYRDVELRKVRLGEKKYEIIRQLGAGSFGNLYHGKEKSTREDVALKIEGVGWHDFNSVKLEYQVHCILQGGDKPVVGIPAFKQFGRECIPQLGYCNVLVMELLGQTLHDLFVICSRQFSLKTVLMLADQMICRLEYLHSKGILHRDVKPENFLIGVGKKAHIVYVADFGLAKKYMDKTGQHNKNRTDKPRVGNPKYCSINKHCGGESSRRDDMESLGYCLINFLRGRLPWDRVAHHEHISEIKPSIPIDKLCEGLPVEFCRYMKTCRRLSFTETPPYLNFRQLFRDLAKREGIKYDWDFDWRQKLKDDRRNERLRIKFDMRCKALWRMREQGLEPAVPNSREQDPNPAVAESCEQEPNPAVAESHGQEPDPAVPNSREQDPNPAVAESCEQEPSPAVAESHGQEPDPAVPNSREQDPNPAVAESCEQEPSPAVAESHGQEPDPAVPNSREQDPNPAMAEISEQELEPAMAESRELEPDPAVPNSREQDPNPAVAESCEQEPNPAVAGSSSPETGCSSEKYQTRSSPTSSPSPKRRCTRSSVQAFSPK